MAYREGKKDDPRVQRRYDNSAISQFGAFFTTAVILVASSSRNEGSSSVEQSLELTIGSCPPAGAMLRRPVDSTTPV